jgi:hypothetical protein
VTLVNLRERLPDAEDLLCVNRDIGRLARRAARRLWRDKSASVSIVKGRALTVNHNARMRQAIAFAPFAWVQRKSGERW